MIKFALAMTLVFCSSLAASTFSYNVVVNSASLSGTPGSLYFQFNPGDVSSDSAIASFSNFQITGPGSLTGSTVVSGGGSGTLPFSLAIANSASNNDALQLLTFGTALRFQVTLAETFTGSALTGSVFNFGLFQPDGVTPRLTSDPDGYSVVINLDNKNRAFAASTTTFATVTPVPSAVPEPAAALLVCSALGAFVLARRR